MAIARHRPTNAAAIALLSLACVLSACAPNTSGAPRDVGNMAYPAPLPQGSLGTTATRMQPPDTGNMAYPAPLPQGNVQSRVIR